MHYGAKIFYKIYIHDVFKTSKSRQNHHVKKISVRVSKKEVCKKTNMHKRIIQCAEE